MDRKNRRTWRRVVWRSREEDRSPGYAIQGEWRACPVVPGWRRKKSFAVRGRPRKASTWTVLAGGSLQPGQAHIGELALAIDGPCWVLSAFGALQH